MAKRPRNGLPLEISVISVEHKFACLPLDLLRRGEQALSVCKEMCGDAAAVVVINGKTMRGHRKIRQGLANRTRREATS